MRHSINTYLQGIIKDNATFILEGGFKSVAEYILHYAEYSDMGYCEFFEDEELESGEPTQAQIDELREYIKENYNYLPNE